MERKTSHFFSGTSLYNDFNVSLQNIPRHYSGFNEKYLL